MKILAVLTLAMVTTLQAQTPAPGFAVVSIRQNRSGEPGGALRVNPGGQIQWINTTLRELMGTAYQRYAFDQREITGGPSWLSGTRFDIVVQTGSGVPPNDPDGFPSQLFAMIRAMLADRFGVAVHNEVREGPIYRLVRARPDGRPGNGMRQVTAGCGAALKALTQGGQAELRPGRGPDCTFGGPPGELAGNAVTVDMLARVIGGTVDRHVVNATGIDGNWDVDLKYSPEFVQGRGAQPGDVPAAATDAPSIFTALQEQLGLKLESARGPVDVLIVDQARMPAEN